MKKLLAAVLATSMCLSYATFASAAQQSSRGLAREVDSQFAITFSAEGGSVTAKVADSGPIQSGAMVDSGKMVTFTAKGSDGNKTYTAAWTGDAVEVDADNSLVATLEVTKAVTVKVKLTEKDEPVVPGGTEYAITFADPANGVLTATKGEATFTTGDKAKKGDVIKFAVAPETGYEVDAWTGATADTVDNVDKTKATLTVVEAAVTVGVTLKAKATGDTFTVKVEQSNGGVLDIYDRTANKYLPVGEDVTIPTGNWLELGYAPAYGAEFDAATVNDKPFVNDVQVTENMTFKATFKAAATEDSEEWYGVIADPSEFVSSDPLTVSGQLKLWYWDGKQASEDKLLSGATFKFSEGYTENDKFTLTEAGAFTSKEPLSKGNYTMQVDVTHGGKTFPEEWVEIFVVDGKLVRVNFKRYVAETRNRSYDSNELVQVTSGTKFGAVEKPTEIPQMYNHATIPGWFNANNKDVKITDDFAITKNLSAMTKFENYKITMLGLDGKPENPDVPDEPEIPTPPSSGGGSSGGGGGSVISGGSTGSNSGSATVSAGTATKEATKAVENAVKAAVSAGSKSADAAVTFKNVKAMTPDAFKAINAAAAKASKGVAVKTSVQMDTVVNGKVAARMYIDPTLAAGLKTAIKTTVDVSPKSKENAKAASVVSKYFNNTAAVVSFAQQGAFGMNVQAAVKVDTSKMNTKTLMFYSYDAKTNKFTALPAPAYFVDTAGYLHFTTPVGGSVVITDKPLSRK